MSKENLPIKSFIIIFITFIGSIIFYVLAPEEYIMELTRKDNILTDLAGIFLIITIFFTGVFASKLHSYLSNYNVHLELKEENKL